MRTPLRSLLLANVVIWLISRTFSLRSSIVLLTVGIFVYLCVIPFIEAAEQTVRRRWCRSSGVRVFGFAQSAGLYPHR